MLCFRIYNITRFCVRLMLCRYVCVSAWSTARTFFVDDFCLQMRRKRLRATIGSVCVFYVSRSTLERGHVVLKDQPSKSRGSERLAPVYFHFLFLSSSPFLKDWRCWKYLRAASYTNAEFEIPPASHRRTRWFLSNDAAQLAWRHGKWLYYVLSVWSTSLCEITFTLLVASRLKNLSL